MILCLIIFFVFFILIFLEVLASCDPFIVGDMVLAGEVIGDVIVRGSHWFCRGHNDRGIVQLSFVLTSVTVTRDEFEWFSLWRP